jgi:UDP-N-acetylmuramoyl-L-alanyl-D-glutamate--2,6-diaminopimelate ligase
LNDESDVAVKLTYGLGQSAQLRASDIELRQDRTIFNLDAEGRQLRFEMPLIGRYNVYNALAAIGAATTHDIGWKLIQKALKKMAPVPGRLERVSTGEFFNVFVDYAHTGDALEQVLKTVREVTTGRLLLLFGCGGSRDVGKRAKMGEVAAKFADYSLVTNDNPRRESPAHIAEQIQEGYREVRTDGIGMELDRRRAIEDIINLAQSGDTVLIAGKGHETYQEFDDTVFPFDDRVIARDALAARALREKASKGSRLDCLLV